MILNVWPGDRDSNPGRCDPQRFSRPPLSTTQPSPETVVNVEAPPGFEPGIRALQAPALATWLWRLTEVVPGAGLEPAQLQ